MLFYCRRIEYHFYDKITIFSITNKQKTNKEMNFTSVLCVFIFFLLRDKKLI